MLKTMLEIRNGERANNPGMTTLMKATSPDDIKALAEYLAGLDVVR
jgi:cytochrome c553